MIAVIRTKVGPVLVGIIVSVIALVFVFYGVFAPGQGGGTAPSVAGEVNGEVITLKDFQQAYRQRLDFFKSMMGGSMKIDEDQIEKQFRLREGVFQSLVQKKLMVQTAKKLGLIPASSQVRDLILTMDAFKKEGRFDKVLYKNLLQANGWTAQRFEDKVAEDLIEQNFRNYLGGLAVVTPEEVLKSLSSQKERRKFSYFIIDSENAKKVMPKDLPQDQQATWVENQMKTWAEEGKSLLQKNSVPSALKAQKVEIKKSDWMNQETNIMLGVGTIDGFQAQMFALEKGQAGVFRTTMGQQLVVLANEVEHFNPSKVTEKEKEEARSRLVNSVQGELLGGVLASMTKDAKIEKNEALVSNGQAQGLPVTAE